MKFKEGYEQGQKVIEIYEGKIDVVLYHENNTGSFYFYRFSPLHVFGEKISKDINYCEKNGVQSFLSKYGRDYDSTLVELMEYAMEHKMTQRYEM